MLSMIWFDSKEHPQGWSCQSGLAVSWLHCLKSGNFSLLAQFQWHLCDFSFFFLFFLFFLCPSSREAVPASLSWNPTAHRPPAVKSSAFAPIGIVFTSQNHLTLQGLSFNPKRSISIAHRHTATQRSAFKPTKEVPRLHSLCTQRCTDRSATLSSPHSPHTQPVIPSLSPGCYLCSLPIPDNL